MNVETKLIQNKLGLLKLAEKLGNVTEACEVYGYSRDSFYRIKELFETGGTLALKEVSRKKPNYKNRIEPELEEAVVQIAKAQPALGQLRASNELKKKGLFIAPCGVRCVWQRHDLETFPKRLKALEARMAEETLILTEAQMIALERKKEKKEATGEIETEHPGYLGAQDTYYVGNIKGVGRIYQQTFIDTYSKVAMAKLYDRKNAITAADMLNDAVLPFFEEQQLPLLRVLTDRGTEYCGKAEYHEYELYLQIEGIDHSKTKARSPQTNGICERFHRTIQDEFYAIAFRKKLYTSLEEMQTDLNVWIKQYNNDHTHSGKYCFGRTPMQTFYDSKQLAKARRIDELLQNDVNFTMPGKTETGSAEEQPARDSQADGNEKTVALPSTVFQHSFLSQMP